MCPPLSHLDTHTCAVPLESSGESPAKARFNLHPDLHNELVAKQTSMIKPNKAKQICQVETLLKLVPFHLRELLKEPRAQHLLRLPSLGHYPSSLYLAPEAPPCQAPGLCSIVADAVAYQVDFRDDFVDFQRFGNSLWPKRCQAGCGLPGHSWCLLNSYVAVDTNTKRKLVIDRLFSQLPRACALLAEFCLRAILVLFKARPTDKTKSYLPESSPVLVGRCRVSREPCKLPLELSDNFLDLQNINMTQRKDKHLIFHIALGWMPNKTQGKVTGCWKMSKKGKAKEGRTSAAWNCKTMSPTSQLTLWSLASLRLAHVEMSGDKRCCFRNVPTTFAIRYYMCQPKGKAQGRPGSVYTN